MKKLLLALTATLIFGSAIANVNDLLIEKNSVNLADNIINSEFVLQKATLNTDTLNIENQVIAMGDDCELICFRSYFRCIQAGYTWCTQASAQCIDTCEGAGGLY